MKKFLFVASASLVMMASCTEEEIFNVENQHVITASIDADSSSRVAVGNDNMLKWSAGDQFVVLSETSSDVILCKVRVEAQQVHLPVRYLREQ